MCCMSEYLSPSPHVCVGRGGLSLSPLWQQHLALPWHSYQDQGVFSFLRDILHPTLPAAPTSGLLPHQPPCPLTSPNSTGLRTVEEEVTALSSFLTKRLYFVGESPW